METQYVNRRGDRYYIFQGKTKTGKPKYYASKRETSDKGMRIDSLPAEFEVFENPGNAMVSVRRRKTLRVLPSERGLVDRLAVDLTAYSCVQTIVDGDQIVIYTPDTDPIEAAAAMERILGSTIALSTEWTKRHTTYSADIRFTLHDEDQRIYFAERYCYRSSIEGWIRIGNPGPLESIAKKLLPHLGKESFYDLI